MRGNPNKLVYLGYLSAQLALISEFEVHGDDGDPPRPSNSSPNRARGNECCFNDEEYGREDVIPRYYSYLHFQFSMELSRNDKFMLFRPTGISKESLYSLFISRNVEDSQ